MCIMEYKGMQVLNKSFKNLLKECDDSSKQNCMFWQSQAFLLGLMWIPLWIQSPELMAKEKLALWLATYVS